MSKSSRDPGQPGRSRTFLLIGGSLGLGFSLLGFLILVSPVDPGQIGEAMADLNPVYVSLIGLTTLLNIVITAAKWRLVTERLRPELRFRNGYFFYTAVTVLVGQVLPPQMSFVTVRSLALRLHRKLPFTTGAASTIYDQIYDFLIPVILLVPSLLVLLNLTGPIPGLLVAVMLASLSPWLAGALGKLLGRAFVRLRRAVPIFRRIVPGKTADDEAEPDSRLLEGRFVRKMMALSLLRYVNLLLRAGVIVAAVGMTIPILAIVHGLPPVQMSTVASVTPASLGIVEWGWSGVLSVQGVDFGTAARFAVLSRILVFAADVLINGGVVLLYLSWYAFRRHFRLNRSTGE